MTGPLRILRGDVLERLRDLDDDSVHCVVTSPPYWGLRDYGTNGQLGLEPTPEEHVARMVQVFREVRRVLRADGTCWVNYGDCYWSGAEKRDGGHGFVDGGKVKLHANKGELLSVRPERHETLKPKDLVGMPWRVAFALQADGWWLRSDIIWAKPNPMPESVTDRPTKAHEYVFLLTKSARYYYDADAVREAAEEHPGRAGTFARDGAVSRHVLPNQQAAEHRSDRNDRVPAGRNLRSVWAIPTHPFPQAHFATFPPKLVEPCVKAGTSEKGCCPQCGAGWERVVERETVLQGNVSAEKGIRGHPGQKPMDGSNTWQGTPRASTATTTLGFRPGCDCEDMPNPGGVVDMRPVPCTVLDPFLGSGTTAIVACGLDRRTIGIELNEQYADMAKRRYREHFGLFATLEE